MSRPADFKKKQSERATRFHAETVLANPERYSRLKVARSEAGLSQKRLSGKAHVSRVAISAIENGREPTSTTRGALAEALNVEIKDLWND